MGCGRLVHGSVGGVLVYKGVRAGVWVSILVEGVGRGVLAWRLLSLLRQNYKITWTRYHSRYVLL